MLLRDRLANLYNDNSKHSNYQNIPDFVRDELSYKEVINEEWRGDFARFKYISESINFENKKVVDIGANTGFFTLSLAERHKNSYFTAYEINHNHIEFMKIICDHFKINNVDFYDSALTLSSIDNMSNSNIILLLNILHHAGVDFDKHMVANSSEYKDYAIAYLNKLTKKTETLVFQIGYNWGGNKERPIINPAQTYKMLQLLKDIIDESNWKLHRIAVYNRHVNAYIDIDIEFNYDKQKRYLDSIDFLNNSEFYRRPILILKN